MVSQLPRNNAARSALRLGCRNSPCRSRRDVPARETGQEIDGWSALNTFGVVSCFVFKLIKSGRDNLMIVMKLFSIESFLKNDNRKGRKVAQRSWRSSATSAVKNDGLFNLFWGHDTRRLMKK